MKPLGAVLAARFPTRFPAWHREVYSATRGMVGHRWTGYPCLLLTSVGRKSGQRRSTVLTYVELDGLPVVAASNGGSDRPPAWFLNVSANPEVEVWRGRRRMTARCEVVDDASPDHRRVWEALDTLRGGRYSGYQQATGRRIPLVRIVPKA